MPFERIDTHSHFLPAFYRDELVRTGNAHPDGMPAIPAWDIETTLSLMRELNITKSILSISSPGVDLDADDPTQAPTLARRCNAFAAELKQKHPARIGYWASLPLPNVSATLSEIETASCEGADGFVLMSNARGHYPGDRTFEPVWAELNRRKAKVFIHPTTPCTATHTAEGKQIAVKATPLAADYPNPIFEFFHDTARVVINLFLTGAVKKYPAITYLIPHVGGAMPPLLNRFIWLSTLGPGAAAISAEYVQDALNNRFYFDLAGVIWGDHIHTNQLVGLLEGCNVRKDRLLYGSDFPFTAAQSVSMLANAMDNGLEKMFSPAEVQEILSGNARKLLSD